MATINESKVSQNQLSFLQPFSPRIPPSIDRHFEQYLNDHHQSIKLPSITKQTNRNSGETLNNNNKIGVHPNKILRENENSNGPISRLLNSEQYRRSYARLIEFRQQSKIPGIALSPKYNSNESLSSQIHGRRDTSLLLKEALNETARNKQHQHQNEFDFVDDESVLSNETDRRHRAKHWIKDHQFFFTEYQ